MKHEGNLIASEHSQEYINQVTEVTGYVDFKNWSGNAPLLQSIGESAYFTNWAGNAPLLQSIGKNADFENSEGNAPLLQSIGESAYFTNWEGNAPLLQSIGRSAIFRNWNGSAPPLLLNKYIISGLIGSRKTNCLYDIEKKEYRTGCFIGSEIQLLERLKNSTNEIQNQYLDFIKQVNIAACKRFYKGKILKKIRKEKY